MAAKLSERTSVPAEWEQSEELRGALGVLQEQIRRRDVQLTQLFLSQQQLQQKWSADLEKTMARVCRLGGVSPKRLQLGGYTVDSLPKGLANGTEASSNVLGISEVFETEAELESVEPLRSEGSLRTLTDQSPSGGNSCPPRARASFRISTDQNLRARLAAPKTLKPKEVAVEEESAVASQPLATLAIPERKRASKGFGAFFETSLLEHRSRRKRGAMAAMEGDEGSAEPDVWRFRRMCIQMVENRHFNQISAFMILVNMVIVGVEAEWMARQGPLYTSSVLFTIEVMLNSWYMVELVVRAVAAGWEVFTNADRWWNLFDLILLLTALFGIFTTLSTWQGELDDGIDVKSLRILRLLKIVRVLRMGRMLRQVKELHKMAHSLANSVLTLFWALVLLLSVVYSFGIWLTEGVTHFGDSCSEDAYTEVKRYFGGLGWTIYYLYLSILGGVTWGEITIQLLECNWSLLFMYLSYISVSMFGVLNIVLGVFVESAMQSIHSSRELMVQTKEENKATFVSHMRHIFNEIDTDRSGKLSHAELVAFLSDTGHPLHAYFDAFELESSDVDALFQLLDADSGGIVDIDEFCYGCLDLKGPAKSYDMKAVQHEILCIQKSLGVFMNQVADKLMLEGMPIESETFYCQDEPIRV